MKEFKVGDKVAVMYEVVDTDFQGTTVDYPIKIKLVGDTSRSACTVTGKFYEESTKQNVFHLEDLQKSEYPKWMMVGNDKVTYKKRYVLCTHNNRFVAVDMASNEKELTEYDFMCAWMYAKDIEPTQTEKELLQIEANEIKAKLTELETKINSL